MKDNLTKICCAVLFVVILMIGGLAWTWKTYLSPEVYESPRIYNHYVMGLDSLSAEVKMTSDSVSLEHYLAYIDSVNKVVIQRSDNYISDVDLMIAKSSAWVGIWIGIFAVVLTVPTVIQLVLAYRNENRVDTMLKDGKQDLKSIENNVKLLENNLKCSIKEHRISSIMMCLSSIPDPLLTPSPDKKRQFVNHYILFLAEEFDDYISYTKESFELEKVTKNAAEDVKKSNMLMVIMMMKMSLIRSQCVFSDITHNIQYRVIQDELDKAYQEVDSGELWNEDLITRLYDIRKKMDILIAALKV